MSDWFEFDDKISHYCGGNEEEEKNNKPKGTQIEMTSWFNPTTLDTETGVITCNACGASPKDDEDRTTIEIGDTDG